MKNVLEHREQMRRTLKNGARVSARLNHRKYLGTVEYVFVQDAMAKVKWDDGTTSHRICVEVLRIV